MTVKELYDYLNNEIPKELSCDWDNDGNMLIADSERIVKKVLVCLDVTDAAVAKAIESKCDLIVSHHPLIFFPLKRITEDNNVSIKLLKLIREKISVFSFHTRLDAAKGGVNDCIAEKIGLLNVESYGCNNEMMGRIGYLETETDADEFAKTLKEKFKCPYINYAKCTDKAYKIAVLGGEGKDFYSSAMSMGADTFVTGDLGYNFITDALEYNMNVICLGHFFSEDVVCKRIAELIKSADNRIETEYYNSFGLSVC